MKRTSGHFGREVASFYLPVDLLTRLDRLANILGESRSEIVNRAITTAVQTAEASPEFKALAMARMKAEGVL